MARANQVNSGIVVVDFGAQYAHLIARRVRELSVYSEIVPYNVSIKKLLSLTPKGIILSGGPSSVYEKGAPILNKDILSLGIPILGICYGQQLIGYLLKGNVIPNKMKEYGRQIIFVKNKDNLLSGLENKEQVWMSHGDLVKDLPKGFVSLASTKTCENAAIGNFSNNIYGVQFHPEVVHTINGMRILRNFVFNVCKAEKNFYISDLPRKMIEEIKQTVGKDGVLMGISGGVDSTVAGTLISKAIGKRFHGIFIDHGLIRQNELEEVRDRYKKLGLNVDYVDASKLFLKRLKGIKDPEKKRKIIGHTFIKVFEAEAKKIVRKYKISYLAQGTIYPDRIESAQPSSKASKIKSHHNLTLPKKMKLKILEPLRDLYKDEVRKVGAELGLSKELLWRHPFPGPGLAIRILGEIDDDKLRILREADHIYISELKKNNLYYKIWQAFAVLIPVKTVGVMGDARTYEYIISLRAVTSKDAMTADWAKIPNEVLEKISIRIVNEVKGVNRVLYDITSKPPGTIEYE